MRLRQDRSESSRAAAAKKKPPAESAGEMALERLLYLAEYELNHDPYRGMLSADSPWSQCQWVEECDGSLAETKVFRTCHCACPSLIYWTEQHDAQVSRKRKRKRKPPGTAEANSMLGHRQDDPTMRCACDFNPLCLASLGGIMDEFLENTAKQVLKDDVLETDVPNMTDSQTVVIDLQDTSEAEGRESKRGKSNSNVSEDVLASDCSCDIDQGKQPSEASQDEIKVEHLELDPAKDKSVYSTMTAEEIKQVRKTCEIETAPVRSWVTGTLLAHLENGSSMTVDDYMKELQKWHDSLSFSNPLVTAAAVKDQSKLRIAIPPGIKNLGATCYLNSQFQCLAQIKAFLDGILSWTPSDTQHQMNSVLSTMQLLFARMVYGSAATLTTEEFSTALGLENDEMQDPNEFARLLFERMSESFQKCSGDGEKEDLSNLLPRLFHGMSTYETTCLSCQYISERNEGFMDLNLPIVHPPKEGPPNSGQLSIAEAFVGAADTTVQYCLDRYIWAEELTGDNQYWCEGCRAKRDALRTIHFQQLPPLLNVQLSRYVFDRKKFVKRKLTDKVLLPLVLTVPMKGKEVDTKYLLCAVMKHHGTSAYQGHYVAEAMDWQSGTWFEFNDENVSVLNGPACSYAPQELDAPGTRKKLKGSQDAYNMYYVEERFLARCATDFLTTKTPKHANVLTQVVQERENRYSMLTEMCLNDGKVAYQLNQRRLGLLNVLSKELTSPMGCVIFPLTSDYNSDGEGGRTQRALSVPGGADRDKASGNEDTTGERKSLPPVWVDGDALRQFFSRDKAAGCNSGITRSGPLLKHKHLLCEHGAGLHPRVARGGKLLPRPIYDAYVSLLLNERRHLFGDECGDEQDVLEGEDDDVNDCVITPSRNMYCSCCAESYKKELKDKIEVLKRLTELSDDLDPKNVRVTIELDDSSADEYEADTPPVFLVSKKFLTTFRKRIASIVKNLGASELQSQLTRRSNGRKVSGSEGLDALDLSEFGQADPATEGRSGSKEELDQFVNSNITCEHGSCNVPNNHAVRRVPQDTWASLKVIFPKAIGHEIRRGTSLEDVRCEFCEKEEAKEEELTKELHAWHSATSSSLSPDILKGSRTIDELSFAILDNDSDDDSTDDVCLVHGEDMDLWRTALKAVKMHIGKTSSTSIRTRLMDLLFPCRKHKREAEEDHQQRVSSSTIAKTDEGCFKGWRPRALMCDDHGLPLECAVFKVNSNLNSNGPSTYISRINTFVEALTYPEYVAFVRSIYDLGKLLFPDDRGPENESSSSTESLARLLLSLRRTHHPQLQSPLSTSEEAQSSLEVPQPGEQTQRQCIHFAEGVCRNARCNGQFAEENVLTASPQNHVEQVDTHDDGSKQPGKKVSTKTDTGSCFLRVFEIEGGADIEAVASSILGISRSGSTSNESETGSLRRSSRKRKTTYRNEKILREDNLCVRADHNIAAIRLFCLEKCPDFRIDQRFTVIIPSASFESGGKSNNHCEVTEEASQLNSHCEVTEEASQLKSPVGPQFISCDLPYDWNDKSLMEIVSKATEDNGLFQNGNDSLLSDVFLFRSDPLKEESKERTECEGHETPVPNETLMDALFELSNCSEPDTKASQSKSKRRTERGFRGTLLHSAPPKPSEDSEVGGAAAMSESTTEAVEHQPHDVGTRTSDAKKKVEDASSQDDHRAMEAKATSQHSAQATSASTSVVILDESDDERLSSSEKSESQRPPQPKLDQFKEEPVSILVSHTKSAEVGRNGGRGEGPEQGVQRLLRSTIVDPKEEELLRELMNSIAQTGGNIPVHQTRCHDAVRWAISTNRRGTVDELADVAFAKYLEESSE